eukprot:4867855-Pyramimonas_sp.AAC.1
MRRQERRELERRAEVEEMIGVVEDGGGGEMRGWGECEVEEEEIGRDGWKRNVSWRRGVNSRDRGRARAGIIKMGSEAKRIVNSKQLYSEALTQDLKDLMKSLGPAQVEVDITNMVKDEIAPIMFILVALPLCLLAPPHLAALR